MWTLNSSGVAKCVGGENCSTGYEKDEDKIRYLKDKFRISFSEGPLKSFTSGKENKYEICIYAYFEDIRNFEISKTGKTDDGKEFDLFYKITNPPLTFENKPYENSTLDLPRICFITDNLYDKMEFPFKGNIIIYESNKRNPLTIKGNKKISSISLKGAKLEERIIETHYATKESEYILTNISPEKEHELIVDLDIKVERDFNVLVNGEYIGEIKNEYSGKSSDTFSIKKNKLTNTTTIKLIPQINYTNADLRYQANIRLIPKETKFITIFAPGNIIPFRIKHSVRKNLDRSFFDWLFDEIDEIFISYDTSLYADFNSDNIPDYPIGRIGGISISDVSSYLLRVLNYEKLPNEEILTMGNDIGSKEIIDRDDKKYQTQRLATMLIIPTEIAKELEKIGYKINRQLFESEYYSHESEPWKNKSLIYHSDHGSKGAAGIYYYEIPYLNNSLVFSDSCLTCATTNTISFCHNAIRKGAIAYVGSVGLTYGSTNSIGARIINSIFTTNDKIGTAFVTKLKSIEEITQDEYHDYTRSSFLHSMLLGYPDLQINPNKLLEEEVFLPKPNFYFNTQLLEVKSE